MAVGLDLGDLLGPNPNQFYDSMIYFLMVAEKSFCTHTMNPNFCYPTAKFLSTLPLKED